ncbi:MAG: HEAT repeat domain-containing protein, partial [Deltaproteobacteria bacterium]
VGPKDLPRVRAAALEAVGRAAASEPDLTEEARRAIAPGLEDRAASVRFGAIAGLEQLGDPEALDLLRARLTREGDDDVKARAEAAIAEIRGRGDDAQRAGRVEERLDALERERLGDREALERLQRRLEALESRP